MGSFNHAAAMLLLKRYGTKVVIQLHQTSFFSLVFCSTNDEEVGWFDFLSLVLSYAGIFC